MKAMKGNETPAMHKMEATKLQALEERINRIEDDLWLLADELRTLNNLLSSEEKKRESQLAICLLVNAILLFLAILAMT